MHSLAQQPYKFIEKKESVYILKKTVKLPRHRIGLVHQYGRQFIVLKNQYGCYDLICVRSIIQ